jgi:hypothetical protein
MTATRVIGPYLLCDTMNAGRLNVTYHIWLGKHRWTCFHARWRTATLSVCAWLDQKFQGRRGCHEWPARSPDPTPCDFFLWGRSKEEVYWAKPCTMEQLEDRIQKVITDIPHDFLQKTLDFIPVRLSKLVDAAGAYIEF